MKNFKNFEDPAPFLMVLKKSVQDNTYSKHPRFLRDPDSPLGKCALEASSTQDQETKCESKALEFTSALQNMEQKTWCFVTVSET